MTRRRTTRIILLAIAAAIAVSIVLVMPPRTRALATEPLLNAPVVRGAYHVHSSRSDGTGTVGEIAAAAGRAGLTFVVVTDHGDGTRMPDPPQYLDGVLVIDAVEISAVGGHVVALGMPASPYPLGGETRDVIADIARLNGVSIAAHPGSPKGGLRWTDWAAPFQGLEWINGDSEWRDEGAGALLRTLITYPFRPAPTLAMLLDRPDAVIRRWDMELARRPVVALAGTDAHGFGLRREPSDDAPALRVPPYEAVFRTMSIGIPRLALSADAAADAEAIVTAIAEGNVFSVADALARPASFAFTAQSSGIQVGIGGRLPVGQPVDLSISTNAPSGSRITLLKDGAALTAVDASTLRFTAPAGPGVYRVEVALAGAPGSPPVPWILSNPIYVQPPWGPAPARARGTERAVQYANGPATGWWVEQSARAQSALDVTPATEGTEISLRYALSGTRAEGPFVALGMPAGPLASYDRISFRIRALSPMRASVELRIPSGTQGERWSRSVYVDDTPRDVTVFFDEMTPRGTTSSTRPDLSKVDSVLFVVDSVATPPGSSGQLSIDDVAFER